MTENKQIDKTKLTPEQRDKLDSWQQAHDQLRVLNDIADISQELVRLFDEQKESGAETDKSMGACLMDMRDSLNSLKDKESPEIPDFAKPIKEMTDKLLKAFSSLDVKPVVNVDAPQVNVSPPSVDLKGIEKLLKIEVPKAFESAISLIPKPEKTDFGPLLTAWEGISEQLESIDIGTRMKPMPGSMTVPGVATESTLSKIVGFDVNADLTTDISTSGTIIETDGVRILTTTITATEITEVWSWA